MKIDLGKELVYHLMNTKRLQRILIQFATLKTNLERVDLVYDLLMEFNLLADIEKDKKNDNLASEFRQKGDDMFKIGKSKDALNFYTKSVAYSVNNSECLGLAYAKRSAVLLQQEMYEECLKDVDRASGNIYSKKLKLKLLSRKREAIGQQSYQKSECYYEPAPTIPDCDRNASFKSASNALKVKYTKELGRHIIAARDIAVGDVVAVERPYAHMLVEELYTHCHECLELCYNLIPCPNCPQVLYCGDTCKQTAYESYHQYECGILGAATDRIMYKFELVSMKIALKAKHEYENVNLADYKLKWTEIYRSDRYKEVHNLVANTDQRIPIDLFFRAVSAAIIYHLIKHNSKFFDKAVDLEVKFKEIVMLQTQTVCCNFHTITELAKDDDIIYTPKHIGDGVFPFLSLFNHSCYPNVMYFSHGKTLVMRAVQSIRKGEQCYENYGCRPAVLTKPVRQAILKKQYFFTCNCVACELNWPLNDNLSGVVEDVLFSFHLKLLDGNRKTVKDMLDQILDELKKLEELKRAKGLYDMQMMYLRSVSMFGNVRPPLK